MEVIGILTGVWGWLPAQIALKAVGIMVAIWFVTAWGFIAMSHAKALRDAGYDFSLWTKAPMYTLLVIFAVADVLFNVTWGSIIFREPPKEGFFTDRVKRHVKESTGWRLDKAEEWKHRLNAFDPGHV